MKRALAVAGGAVRGARARGLLGDPCGRDLAVSARAGRGVRQRGGGRSGGAGGGGARTRAARAALPGAGHRRCGRPPRAPCDAGCGGFDPLAWLARLFGAGEEDGSASTAGRGSASRRRHTGRGRAGRGRTRPEPGAQSGVPETAAVAPAAGAEPGGPSPAPVAPVPRRNAVRRPPPRPSRPCPMRRKACAPGR